MTKWSFTVSIIPTHPFLMNRRLLENSHRMFKDSELNLLETMQEKLNFSYKTTFPFDYEWGAEQPDGSWSGMIGQLVEEEADFAVSYMTLTYPRSKAVYFTKPYFTSKLRFFTRPPTLSTPNLQTLIRPFSWQVWTALSVSLILVSSVIYVMGKFRTLPQKQPKFLSVIWSLFGICIYQSGNIMTSEKTRCRLLIACWLLTVIVLTPTYSGILTSLLAVPMKEYVAENIEELNEHARTGRVKVGTIVGSAYYDDILQVLVLALNLYIFSKQHAPNKRWKYIQESLANEENIADGHEDGLRRLYSEENYVFICSEEVGMYAMRRLRLGGFYMSKDLFREYYNGIATKKNFPLKKEFNSIITRMTESGLINEWYTLMTSVEAYLAEMAYLEGDFKYTETGFGIMLGPFMILITGYVISFMVFITEVIASFVCKK